MAVKYQMEDDNTLSATSDVPGTKGVLCRYFNFASRQVTTIFCERADKEMVKYFSGSAPAVSASVATALTSQLTVQNFRDIESQQEIELMRERLVKLGGKPADAPDALQKQKTPRPGLGG